MRVDFENGSYDILIESLNYKSFERYKGVKATVITDTTVNDLYGENLKEVLRSSGIKTSFIVLPPGEGQKSIQSLQLCYSKMLDFNMTRSDIVIAHGGGVMGDLAGLVAATYMRGIRFVQIPTTLLAQVDSSVGGKVAVNMPKAKNSVGTFYQPDLVLTDTGTLKTLPKREYAAGMAEVIKYAAIADEKFAEDMENMSINDIVARCCEIKADYVRQDPFDKGKRMELNFGHTLGHAIESCCGYGNVLHGEGVAIGMVFAAKLGEFLGITPKDTEENIRKLLKINNLPVEIPDIKKEELINAMYNDKKNLHGKVNFVLLERFGKAKVCEVDMREVEKLL